MDKELEQRLMDTISSSLGIFIVRDNVIKVQDVVEHGDFKITLIIEKDK